MTTSGSNKAIRALPIPGMMAHSVSQSLLTRMASPPRPGDDEDNYNLQAHQLQMSQPGKSFSTLAAARLDSKSFTAAPNSATHAGGLRRPQSVTHARERDDFRLNNLLEHKQDIVLIGDGNEKLPEMMKTIKEQIALAATEGDPGDPFAVLDLADMNKFVGYKTPKLRISLQQTKGSLRQFRQLANKRIKFPCAEILI